MSGQQRTGSGGVRNLLAMFENKDDTSTSPPDRGRSPAGSVMSARSNGASPRPLSKVRTSFVAVERSGQLGNQLGLKREQSSEDYAGMPERQSAFSTSQEGDPKGTAERKKSLGDVMEARKNSTVIEETIPESAIETPTTEPQKSPVEINKVEEKPRKTADLSENSTSNRKDKKSESTLEGISSSQESENGVANGGKIANNTPSASKAIYKTSEKPQKPTSSATNKSLEKLISKPASISKTRGQTTPSKSVADTASKSKVVSGVEQKITSAKKPIAASPTSTTRAKDTGSSSLSSKTNLATAKTSQPSNQNTTGFVKSKPRSPTRPIKLPASMTAPTASSLSKTAPGTTAPSSHRNSISSSQAQLPGSSDRSMASRHKPSTSNSRFFGKAPPRVRERPTTESSRTPGERFLSRMMRPTESSAHKTHEKVVTPPKKLATKPSLRELKPPQLSLRPRKSSDRTSTMHPNKSLAEEKIDKQSEEAEKHEVVDSQKESLATAMVSQGDSEIKNVEADNRQETPTEPLSDATPTDSSPTTQPKLAPESTTTPVGAQTDTVTDETKESITSPLNVQQDETVVIDEIGKNNGDTPGESDRPDDQKDALDVVEEQIPSETILPTADTDKVKKASDLPVSVEDSSEAPEKEKEVEAVVQSQEDLD